MLLYIKQKFWSFADKYDIYDVNMKPIFSVEGEYFTFLSKFHIYDLYGKEIYYIKRNLTFICAEYEIYSGNMHCATVNQEFSFFHPRLTVSSKNGDFDIDGDFLAMSFDIYYNDRLFGKIRKKYMTIGDFYELEVIDDNNAGFFVALVIALDNCIHNGKKN